MTRLHPWHATRRIARGLSLVELMVAVAIGMITVAVMMQILSLTDNAKRTTTGSDDAQTAGAIAVSMLQRDVRQSGLGLSSTSLLGCRFALPPPATWSIANVGPLTINSPSIPAGDANTDTLLVMASESRGTVEGDRVVSVPAAAQYWTATPTSFLNGDVVVAVPNPAPAPCNLTVTRVTNNPVLSPPAVTVGTATAGMPNGTLFNLGPALHVTAYAVRNGALTSCDYVANDCSDATQVNNTAVWVPLGDNIVSLRAQYGRDTSFALDRTVDVWDTTTPLTPAAWQRVVAVRLVLVARQAKREGDTVTTASPVWSAASAALDLSGFADWQHYRYRTLETVVPMRNLLWAP